MIVLWFFGPDMEDHYGPKEFLVFYLVAGVCLLKKDYPFAAGGFDPVPTPHVHNDAEPRP